MQTTTLTPDEIVDLADQLFPLVDQWCQDAAQKARQARYEKVLGVVDKLEAQYSREAAAAVGKNCRERIANGERNVRFDAEYAKYVGRRATYQRKPELSVAENDLAAAASAAKDECLRRRSRGERRVDSDAVFKKFCG